MCVERGCVGVGCVEVGVGCCVCICVCVLSFDPQQTGSVIVQLIVMHNVIMHAQRVQQYSTSN